MTGCHPMNLPPARRAPLHQAPQARRKILTPHRVEQRTCLSGPSHLAKSITGDPPVSPAWTTSSADWMTRTRRPASRSARYHPTIPIMGPWAPVSPTPPRAFACEKYLKLLPVVSRSHLADRSKLRDQALTRYPLFRFLRTALGSNRIPPRHSEQGEYRKSNAKQAAYNESGRAVNVHAGGWSLRVVCTIVRPPD